MLQTPPRPIRGHVSLSFRCQQCTRASLGAHLKDVDVMAFETKVELIEELKEEEGEWFGGSPDKRLELLERVYCATPLSLLQLVSVDRGTGADERLPTAASKGSI